MQIIGEAALRLRALTKDLKDQIQADLNEALNKVKTDANPLANFEREVTRASLELTKAQEGVYDANGKLSEAEKALAALQRKGTASADDLARAQLRVNRALLEVGAASDRVRVAEGSLAKAHLDLGNAADESGRKTHRFRDALFDSSSILGIFKKSLDAATGRGDASGSMFDRIKDKAKNAGEKGVRAFGRIFDEVFTGKTIQAGGLKALGAIGSSVFSVLTSKAALMGGGVAAALGGVGGLVAAFPALAVVGGAAMGAIALGMDGIKKAASGLAPQIDKLKDKVSDAFAKGMKPAFQDISKILPTVQTGLVQMAGSLSGVFKQVTSSLRAPEALGDLKTALSGASSFIANLGTGLSDMFTSIIHSAAAVAPVMDDLGASIGHIFSAISGAFNRAANTGKLLAAARGIRQVFDAIADVLGPLLDLLFDFAAQLAGPLAGVLSSFGGALKGAMPGLHQFGAGIAQALNAVAPVVKSLGPLFGQLAGVVGGALGSAVKALAPALTILINGLSKALAPVLPVLSKAFADLSAALAPVLAQFAGVFVQVLNILLPMIPVILDGIQQLAPAFLSLVQALLPLLPPMAQLIATILPPLIQLFVTILRPIIELTTAIVTKLVPAITKILSIAGSVVTGVLNFFNNFSTNVQAILSKVGAFFTSIWESIKNATIQRVTALVNGAKNIFNSIIGFVTSTFNSVKSAITGALGNIANAVSTGIGKVVQFFKNLPGNILRGLGNLGSLLLHAGADLIQGLLNGLANLAGKVLDFFKNLISNAVDSMLSFLGISSPSKLMAEMGRNVGRGLIKGIGDMTPAVGLAGENMADRLARGLSPMSTVVDQNLANLWKSPGRAPGLVPSAGAASVSGTPALPQNLDLEALAAAVADGVRQLQVVVSGREVTSKVNRINQVNKGR